MPVRGEPAPVWFRSRGGIVTDRTSLDLYIPEEVDEIHKGYVADKYGEASGSRGRAIDDAIQEFTDEGPLAQVESDLDAALDALDDADAKKTVDRQLDGHPIGGDTVKVNCNVLESRKESLVTFARELDVEPKVVASHALYEQAGPVRNRLQRVMDKTAAIREAVEAGAASSGSDTVNAIVARLDAGFTLQDFLDAAETAGVTTRKYAIQEKLPDVLDRTGAIPNPDTPEVFLPPNSDLAPDNPNPANLPYYAQSDADRRVGVQVAGLRKAWDNGGKAKLTVQEAVDALAGEGSPRHKTARSVMQAADKNGVGFRYDADDEVLVMNVDDVEDDRVLNIAAEERARENAGEGGGPTGMIGTDESNAVDDPDGVADHADQRLAELADAEHATATDGGGS